MYACRKPTRISKPVTPTFKQRTGRSTMIGAFSSVYAVSSAERGEQDVAGHHVGEESDRQRERPHEEDLDELDRRHEDVERLRHARREQVAGEVLEALVLEARRTSR